MKYQISNKKVNIILDELAEEYKNLLIETALNQNQEFDVENISISDITKIDIETKERLKNRSRNNRINRISHLISSLGLVYSLFGLMLIMVSEAGNDFTDNPLSSVAIICVFLGFIIAIVGLMTKMLLNNKKSKISKKSIMDYEIQIINKWRIIEGIIYQTTPNNDKLSLRSMINNLEQSKIISKEDVKLLNSLMFYRNKILHNAPGEVKYNDEIKTILDDAQELIEKLSKII